MEKILTKSQEIIQKAGIPIRLSLAEKIIGDDGKLKGTRSTGLHRVKFIQDKVVNGKDFQTGKERLEMKYIFEEDGQKKFYTKPLKDDKDEVSYFVEKMSQFNYGDELVLRYVPKGLRGYIDARMADRSEIGEETPSGADLGATGEAKLSSEVSDDEIPIINEDDEPLDIKDIPL